MIFKKIYLNIDNQREKLEDFIADKILKNLDSSDTLDTIEEKAIIVAFEAADAYLATYGVPSLPDSIKEKIAKASVKVIGKANRALQKQLKKK